ncbi:MAG: alpha-hydroxy-acid oxidizing protein [Chloroflexi bacterium]|nr:alpha-hydroxy-acid oxidizing protein [Chloroflexota bacterium]
MRANGEWLTIPEIVRAARARLAPHIWDFAAGGAESETTLRRNRAAFDCLTFRPRVLRDVRHRDLSTTFLGHSLSLPVMLAPVGSIQHFHPDGALACARVAERAGTITFVSTVASPSLEDVRAGSKGPLVFQLYVRGDREWLRAMIGRVERAGYAAVCVTVDSAAYGRRERDLENRYLARQSHGRPNLAVLPGGVGEVTREQYQAALTWDDVDWLRSMTSLPLMLKGVLCPEDAELAVQHGVDVVYVSNHGGRQLDHAPATVEVLPEIVCAVAGRADVIVDSGFMRGTDVLKALALGARAVLVGKLMAWGLAAGGEGGLECALDLLRDEIGTTMANIGVRTTAELGPACVRPSIPIGPEPGQMSSIPGIRSMKGTNGAGALRASEGT